MILKFSLVLKKYEKQFLKTYGNPVYCIRWRKALLCKTERVFNLNWFAYEQQNFTSRKTRLQTS